MMETNECGCVCRTELSGNRKSGKCFVKFGYWGMVLLLLLGVLGVIWLFGNESKDSAMMVAVGVFCVVPVVVGVLCGLALWMGRGCYAAEQEERRERLALELKKDWEDHLLKMEKEREENALEIQIKKDGYEQQEKEKEKEKNQGGASESPAPAGSGQDMKMSYLLSVLGGRNPAQPGHGLTDLFEDAGRGYEKFCDLMKKLNEHK